VFLFDASLARISEFFWVPQIQGSITPHPPSKSFRRVVEWHDQLVSSKSLNITKIYQLIDELTWLHGKNNVL
jgi:hypothetical protein